MRKHIFTFLSLLGILSACTTEFVPEEVINANNNAVINPTEDPTGRKGAVEANFLSSESNYTFSESAMTTSTFRVSFVTTAQNFDIFKWVFEGGTVSTTVASSTVVSGSTTIEGNINDPDSESQIGVLVSYNQGFGRYDVTHAVANADSYDVNFINDYVTYEYLDDLQVKQEEYLDQDAITTGWENPQQGWFGPQNENEVTYENCENSIVGFYQAINGDESIDLELSKIFSNFGVRPKNLVFEYKLNFLVLPGISESERKISLGYTPVLDGDNLGINPSELWYDNTFNATEYRQVIIPLPLIPNFKLTFTKHPSILNDRGQQRFPFTVCIRDIRIIPGNNR